VNAEAKYTGIIFQGWGVKAVLEGRKTNTRRTQGLDFINQHPNDWQLHDVVEGTFLFRNPNGGSFTARCPYGQVGDRLWVRETFSYKPVEMGSYTEWRLIYRADDPNEMDRDNWKPSIHMKRIDSRITLEITGVKVERIQDISEGESIAEGSQIPCDQLPPSCRQAVWTERQQFSKIWDSINAKRGYGWDVNPWVWALTFKVVE